MKTSTRKRVAAAAAARRQARSAAAAEVAARVAAQAATRVPLQPQAMPTLMQTPRPQAAVSPAQAQAAWEARQTPGAALVAALRSGDWLRKPKA